MPRRVPAISVQATQQFDLTYQAEAVALELWGLGYAVICPHKNSALFDGAAPDEVWLEGSLELLRRSDGVVLFGEWRASAGTMAEKREAERLGMPVYEWPRDWGKLEAA